ncbi:hypothetical protein DFH06DRAFT_1139690 [Mycena polygramma]|nr:hypothetical protein DFH06DRAFT_1139690 [Mycena polygramma]
MGEAGAGRAGAGAGRGRAGRGGAGESGQVADKRDVPVLPVVRRVTEAGQTGQRSLKEKLPSVVSKKKEKPGQFFWGGGRPKGPGNGHPGRPKIKKLPPANRAYSAGHSQGVASSTAIAKGKAWLHPSWGRRRIERGERIGRVPWTRAVDGRRGGKARGKGLRRTPVAVILVTDVIPHFPGAAVASPALGAFFDVARIAVGLLIGAIPEKIVECGWRTEDKHAKVELSRHMRSYIPGTPPPTVLSEVNERKPRRNCKTHLCRRTQQRKSPFGEILMIANAAFDDETRPDALLILAHALILRQQRLVIERQEVFARLCKKARHDHSLQLYKKKEDARRDLAQSRQVPPGVPDDCPIVLVDGVIEILVDGDSEDGDREDDSNTPRTLSEIEQDDTESHSSDAEGQSQEDAAAAAHSLDEDAAAAADSLDEDAATAADSLDALAALPSPLIAPGLLPSPDLPSPTYNSRAHPARCRSFDRACRYAYGPARLEGQTDNGEGVEDTWRRLRRGPAEEYEFRAGFARGLERAWEIALAPPSTPEPGDKATTELEPTTQTSNGDLPSTSEVASGDLTLDKIAEVENAWRAEPSRRPSSRG